jgi:hypothetical protein
VKDGRLVPNASEQAALARVRAMREAGETHRTIGAEVGRDPNLSSVSLSGRRKGQQRAAGVTHETGRRGAEIGGLIRIKV